MFSNKPFLISRHEPCLVEGRHSNLQLIHRRQPVAVRKHSCNPHKSHLGSIPFPLSDSSEASSQPSCTEEAQPSPTPAPPTPALPENAEPLFTSSFDHRGAVRVAATAALVYTLIGSRVPNAHALVVDEDREWKPRRHHRRLDERVSNTWAADAVEEEEAVMAIRQQGITAAQQQRLQLERAEMAKQREADLVRRKQLQSLSTQAPSTGQLPFSLYVGSTDVAPYLVWGSVVIAITYFIRASIWESLFNRSKKKVEGRWVYDRSLGGKKIWVTEGDATPAGSREIPGVPVNAAPSSTPTLLRDEKFQRLASLAAAASPTVAAASSFSTESPAAAAQGVFVLPAWWRVQRGAYVGPGEREIKQEEANRICRRLESSKVRGVDYSIDDIVLLRKTCQEGYVTVVTKTQGARDSIFRTAVEAAATAAMATIGSSNAQLGDESSPLQFVVNIAADLEVPEERAVPMILSVAAATARMRLLEAVTCLKVNNETGCMVAIARLVLLLQRLPVILEGSKEAELIASSLAGSSKVEERSMLFITGGRMMPELAVLLAQMLGFDPRAVVPQLDRTERPTP